MNTVITIVPLRLHDPRSLSYALGIPHLSEAQRELILENLIASENISIIINILRYERWRCVTGRKYLEASLAFLSSTSDASAHAQILKSLSPREDLWGYLAKAVEIVARNRASCSAMISDHEHLLTLQEASVLTRSLLAHSNLDKVVLGVLCADFYFELKLLTMEDRIALLSAPDGYSGVIYMERVLSYGMRSYSWGQTQRYDREAGTFLSPAKRYDWLQRFRFLNGGYLANSLLWECYGNHSDFLTRRESQLLLPAALEYVRGDKKRIESMLKWSKLNKLISPAQKEELQIKLRELKQIKNKHPAERPLKIV